MYMLNLYTVRRKKRATQAGERKNQKKPTVQTITTYWKLHNGFYYKHVIASITATQCFCAVICSGVWLGIPTNQIGLELHDTRWSNTMRERDRDRDSGLERSIHLSNEWSVRVWKKCAERVYGTCHQSATRNIRWLCCTNINRLQNEQRWSVFLL